MSVSQLVIRVARRDPEFRSRILLALGKSVRMGGAKMTMSQIKAAPVGTAIEVAPNSKARELALQWGSEPESILYVRGKEGWTSNAKIEPGGQKGVAQIFRGPFLQDSSFQISANEKTVSLIGHFELFGDRP